MKKIKNYLKKIFGIVCVIPFALTIIIVCWVFITEWPHIIGPCIVGAVGFLFFIMAGYGIELLENG